MLIFLSFKMTVKMQPLTSEVVNCIACSCLSLWFFWVCLFKASGELGVAFDVSLQLWQLSGCNLQKTGRSTKYLLEEFKKHQRRDSRPSILNMHCNYKTSSIIQCIKWTAKTTIVDITPHYMWDCGYTVADAAISLLQNKITLCANV